MIDFSKYNSAIDNPDSRDIPAEDVLDLMATADLPRKAKVAERPMFSQGAIGACTAFGASGALFATAIRDAERNGTVFNAPYDIWKLWAKAKERGASDSQGWYIQSMIQLVYDLGYSKGYLRVNKPYSIDPTPLKRAIASGYGIDTGSAKGDWGKIIRTGEYSEQASLSGHSYDLNEYDDDHVFSNGDVGGFYSKNSFGDTLGFWISYKQVPLLFSTYIQLDPSDVDAMKDYRNVLATLYVNKAIEKKIVNGERMEEIASDDEIYIMCQRGLDILGARSRQYWATTFEEKILKGKGIMDIWNTKDGAKLATAKEVATMFTRSVKRDSKEVSGVLTRRQVASVIGRDFL